MLQIRTLYKYTKQEYAEAMLANGTVRIGTLFSYRDEEFGPAIGDSGEGSSETTQAVGAPLDIAKPENRSWVVDKFFRMEDPAENVTLDGLSLVVPEQSPDFFIYCASHRFSGRAMRAFKADACVEITRPNEFLKALVDTLRERGDVLDARLAPCDYSGRARNERMTRVHPGLLKDPRYEYQKEIRLLMRPTLEARLEPFLIDVPAIRTSCRIRPRG